MFSEFKNWEFKTLSEYYQKMESLEEACGRILDSLPLEQRAVLEKYYTIQVGFWENEAREAYARGYACGAKSAKAPGSAGAK